MDGSDSVERTTAYLGRLLGEPVSADQPVRLRSVQRAALASWARKHEIPIRSALTGSDAPFSARDLLQAVASADEKQGRAPLANPVRHPGLTTGANVLTSVGIDIEDVDSLPLSDDYREHPFFQDHFTPAEISYCIRQPDVAASFCGTWAAKEALLKTGLVPMPATLNTIEIGRDPVGRPTHPGCQLSISHTKRAAVAICLVVASPVVLEEAPTVAAPDGRPDMSRHREMSAAPMVCFGAAILGALAFATWHVVG